MSILSHSKASLRGSQPFPDPAFSFQPHTSFPLSFAAATFWCLWLWVEFFSCFLHWSSRRWSTWGGAAEGRPGGQGMQQRQVFIFPNELRCQSGFPAAATKPKWPLGLFLKSQAGESSVGTAGTAWGRGGSSHPTRITERLEWKGFLKAPAWPGCSEPHPGLHFQGLGTFQLLGHPEMWAEPLAPGAQPQSAPGALLSWAHSYELWSESHRFSLLHSSFLSPEQLCVSAGIEENQWRFQGISECFTLTRKPSLPSLCTRQQWDQMLS